MDAGDVGLLGRNQFHTLSSVDYILGGTPSPPTLLLKAYKTDGVKVFWNSPAELVICYGQPTHIYDFRNYYEYAEETWDHLYKVEVLLRRVQKLQEC